MPIDDPDDPTDFRDRLARIPRVDEPSAGDPWATATPPVVKRPGPVAPVARPAQVSRPEMPLAESEMDAEPDGYEPTPEFEPVGGRRRRRRWPLVLFALFAFGAIAVLVPLYMARQVFNNVERVPVADVLTPALPAGTNILLVGTDSRAGIDAQTENAGAIIGGEEAIVGERTDTIMILRLQEDGSAKFLSLPRDLWLPINGGEFQRINTAFRDGPEGVINTVQLELGIPISHYVQVDLVGFIGLVDAVGGVEINVANPAFDRNSGLNLATVGPVVLDSAQALAYVRSRFYTEIIDGVEVVDGTSDIGRVQRQQEFMRALMAKLATQRDPRVLNEMGSAMADAIVMDDATSFTKAIEIANTLRSTTPESVVLPTRNARVGRAAVLEMTEEASAVLAQFGG